jgi:hypothetical protein
MRVLQRLLKSIRAAAIFNPDVQVAPSCILWPDRNRQWETIVQRLQAEMPELLVLGRYAPEKKTGPAIWLRCILSGVVEELSIPVGRTPVFYLPAVSRQDLRAVESCPDHLKPLAELQYRGVIWSQINAKDWTILAFLKSDQGGLGLDVAQDSKTKNAMQLALYRLLDEDLIRLQDRHLDKDYFNTLLTGGDPVRDLLQWIDQGDAFKGVREKHEWLGFVEVCKSQLGFNPDNDGVLTGAGKLAAHNGPWHPVWERFCEAPNRYPNIPAKIRQCTMPDLTLFSNSQTHGSWPQWNETQENDLRRSLKSLKDLPPHEARKQILDLDKKHRDRRKLVWAEIGESQLALASKHLANLIELVKNPIAGGTIEDVKTMYCSFGWKADSAVLGALSCINNKDNLEAVFTAIRAVYLPWVEESARYFQKLVQQSSYPGVSRTHQKIENKKNGECVLFVDGLRFDLAKRLIATLTRKNYHIAENPVWAALPTVTATCKPAVSPVKAFIMGDEVTTDFEPTVAATGQSLKGGYHFKKLLNENNWTFLDKSNLGNGNGSAWCEFGDIDHEGHQRGWKIALLLDRYINDILEQIEQLFLSGWKTVRIVTDHGWLLMPGELPKTDLPAALVKNKWGRCAVLKEGAATGERTYSWYWDPNKDVALADGVSCYKKGEEYAHGGLSLQECLTLALTVTPGMSEEPQTTAEITDVVWKGLRCKVAVEGEISNISLDIRSQAGNSSTSIVMNVKPIKESGIGSVVVDKEDFEGSEAFIVLINDKKDIIAQTRTIIGGDEQ